MATDRPTPEQIHAKRQAQEQAKQRVYDTVIEHGKLHERLRATERRATELLEQLEACKARLAKLEAALLMIRVDAAKALDACKREG